MEIAFPYRSGARALARGFRLALVLLAAGCARNAAGRGGPFPGFSEFEGRTVSQVAFTGDLLLPLDSLRAVTTVRPPTCAIQFLPSLICPRTRHYRLDLSDLASDVVRLQLYYRDHGFYGTRVVPDVEATGDDEVAVSFGVAPGDQVTLRSLDVEGVDSLPEIDPAREIEGRIPLQEGDPFGRVYFLAAADSIRAVLYRHGYAYAEVLRNYSIDTIADIAEVTYEAVPGPLVRVDSIEIVGADRLDRRTVMKEMAVRPGDILPLPALAESQRNLYQLPIVNFASVELAPDSLQADADSSTATVLVRVVEAAKYVTNATLGFGTVECVRTGARLMDRNFLGGGRTLELSASAARIGAGEPVDFGFRSRNFCGGQRGQLGDTVLTYRIAADYRQPRLFGTHTRLSLNVHAERQAEIALFLRRSVGSQFSVSREVAPGVAVGVGLQVDRGSTEATQAIFCVVFTACTDVEQQPLRSPRLSNAATLSASIDRVGGAATSVRGWRAQSSLAWSSPALLSDDRYLNLLAEVSGFRPLGRGMVLAARVQGGTFLGSNGPAGYIPVERRFYAGGPNSVRGFPPNALGPIAYITTKIPYQPDYSDISTQQYPLGGTRMLTGTLELRLPSAFLSQYLRWAAFVDAGQVWAPGLHNPDTDVDFGTGRLAVTPGVGVRITTPVGPIRVDVAYNPGLRTGPLYYTRVDDQGRPAGTLELLAPNFQPLRTRWLDRLEFQLAVGQAFC
jgi:outer membrane protein assembly complex protein YaeT